MTESDLMELADRCEKLEGPCRETDRAIMASLNLKPDYAGDWGTRGHERPAAFAYTASVDAGVALVPYGWQWSIEKNPTKPAQAWLYKVNSYLFFTVTAATPALALTAAALLANASMAETGRGG